MTDNIRRREENRFYQYREEFERTKLAEAEKALQAEQGRFDRTKRVSETLWDMCQWTFIMDAYYRDHKLAIIAPYSGTYNWHAFIDFPGARIVNHIIDDLAEKDEVAAVLKAAKSRTLGYEPRLSSLSQRFAFRGTNEEEYVAIRDGTHPLIKEIFSEGYVERQKDALRKVAESRAKMGSGLFEMISDRT